MDEEKQRQLELAMARGDSILFDGDGKVITDSPAESVTEKKEEPKVEEKKEKPKEGEVQEEPVVPRISLKHIPVSKYTEEKREWKAELEKRDAQITELNSKLESAAAEGRKFSEFEMKDYFQRFNIPESQQPAVKEMLALAAKQRAVPEEVTARIGTMEAQLAEFADKQRFDADWRGFAGDLVRRYPDATYSQLEEAKEAMDILSHHEDRYLDKELDYIAFREKPVFDEIFSRPVKKGFESRSQNADSRREQPRAKLDTESMTPAQVLEYERRIDEETRSWDKGVREDSQGNKWI